MNALHAPTNYLYNFHRLLRHLRAETPLRQVAQRGSFDGDMLQQVEAGLQPVEEPLAREILARGFPLEMTDIDRLILGVKLYDLGLRDNAIRPLVTDIILNTAPISIRRHLRKIYKKYTAFETST